MNNDLINQLAGYVIKSSYIEDAMEARGPLHEAGKIWKQLNPEELVAVEKKIILGFLERKNYASAVNWLTAGEWPFNREILLADPEIKQAAAMAYQEAASSQLEIADDIKKAFNVV